MNRLRRCKAVFGTIPGHIVTLGLALGMTFGMSRSASAGQITSTGGDPSEIIGSPYADQVRLTEAVALLRERMQMSAYPQDFREAFLLELDFLHARGLFLYVPTLTVLPHARHEGDYIKLVSVGAFTWPKRGAPVYFTQAVDGYSALELARVIAQEIPHHILSGASALDENFVNALGSSLLEGKVIPFTPVDLKVDSPELALGQGNNSDGPNSTLILACSLRNLTSGKGIATGDTALIRDFVNSIHLDIGEGVTAEIRVRSLPWNASFDLKAEILIRESGAGPRGENAEFRFERLLLTTDTGRSDFARWKPIKVLSSLDQRIQLDCILFDERYDD